MKQVRALRCRGHDPATLLREPLRSVSGTKILKAGEKNTHSQTSSGHTGGCPISPRVFLRGDMGNLSRTLTDHQVCSLSPSKPPKKPVRT
jgi:hypothetical protein